MLLGSYLCYGERLLPFAALIQFDEMKKKNDSGHSVACKARNPWL